MVEEVEVQGRIHTHTHTEDKCSKQIWLCHCTLYILAHQHFWGVTLYILNYVSMNVSKEILPRSGRGCSKQWTRAKVDLNRYGCVTAHYTSLHISIFGV